MDYCYIILFQGDFTMAKEVTVYTMNRCPFCLQLKLFLKRQGVEFTEINTSEHPEVLKMLQDETSFLTLPQVFVDDNFLGGYDNIIDLHQKGKFKRIFGLEE